MQDQVVFEAETILYSVLTFIHNFKTFLFDYLLLKVTIKRLKEGACCNNTKNRRILTFANTCFSALLKITIMIMFQLKIFPNSTQNA